MNLLKCGKVKIFGKDNNKSKLNARKKKIRENVKVINARTTPLNTTRPSTIFCRLLLS
jgi:hypothetical protein